MHSNPSMNYTLRPDQNGKYFAFQDNSNGTTTLYTLEDIRPIFTKGANDFSIMDTVMSHVIRFDSASQLHKPCGTPYKNVDEIIETLSGVRNPLHGYLTTKENEQYIGVEGGVISMNADIKLNTLIESVNILFMLPKNERVETSTTSVIGGVEDGIITSVDVALRSPKDTFLGGDALAQPFEFFTEKNDIKKQIIGSVSNDMELSVMTNVSDNYDTVKCTIKLAFPVLLRNGSTDKFCISVPETSVTKNFEFVMASAQCEQY